MPATVASTQFDRAQMIDAVQRIWGFDSLRPLQEQAIRAGLEQRDSLIVMPTGGGKSLCYQVPPLLAGRCDVVVSPLISLMKDQVDGLIANGYPAAAVHSHLSAAEKVDIFNRVNRGEVRLLFTSPERLSQPRFQQWLKRLDIRAFAIDEAHCISHWGHDFRPEYRRLASLKQQFPGASLHAFTATATPRVRTDIVEQLGLTDSNVLVGDFDRPNLVYRVLPRVDRARQVLEIIRRHPREAVIVYCITRNDTETLAGTLLDHGIKAAHYHAGMEPRDRKLTQDAFAQEELDVIVATVAFGMGIDRSNVRCVIHAAMPKTIEHYQQESGRAGRDGLEAECIMLYSTADVIRWKELISFSAKGADDPETTIAAQEELLDHMQGLCNTLGCRHRALVRYFGQTFDKPSCEACDVCLGEIEPMADSTVIAQKILSCIARLQQRYGIAYTAQVLKGSRSHDLRSSQHASLSTFGILKDFPEQVIKNLIYQLIDQGLIDRTTGDKPVLHLNNDSWAVLRCEREIALLDPRQDEVTAAATAEISWEGVDRGTFDHLRELRKKLAAERNVPAFVIFSDATLRELARVRPTSRDNFRLIQGVGDAKLESFGDVFTEATAEYCRAHGLETDQLARLGAPTRVRRPRTKEKSSARREAERMFAEGASIEEVAEAVDRRERSVANYLAEYIEEAGIDDVSPWVDDETYERVIHAIDAVGSTDRLRPIFVHLDEEVPYDKIKVVVAHVSILS